ncbi:hypothetical protein [Edaphocola aurantiacus]|uniref:hypothetical protein n=1 Tax=Edaphocola aurantiacus TaxID=2601682 RepID=UPI001C93D445|nr:hypothetical protein [Edaphocola aurantiacus]
MIFIKNTAYYGTWLPIIIIANNGIVHKISGFKSEAILDIEEATEVIVKPSPLHFSTYTVKVDNDSVIVMTENKVHRILFLLAWISCAALQIFRDQLHGFAFYAVLAIPIVYLLCLVYLSLIQPKAAFKVKTYSLK